MMSPELRAACDEYADKIAAQLPPITDSVAVQAAHIIASASPAHTEPQREVA